MLKKCTSCLEIKDIDFFHWRGKTKKSRRANCKSCEYTKNKQREYLTPENCRKNYKKYYNKNKDFHENRRLKSRFGITIEQRDQMTINQNNLCAICEKPERITSKGKTKRLAIDHCHETGQVRGLLCSMCNTGIGKLNDDINMLKKAILYLEKFPKP